MGLAEFVSDLLLDEKESGSAPRKAFLADPEVVCGTYEIEDTEKALLYSMERGKILRYLDANGSPTGRTAARRLRTYLQHDGMNLEKFAGPGNWTINYFNNNNACNDTNTPVSLLLAAAGAGAWSWPTPRIYTVFPEKPQAGDRFRTGLVIVGEGLMRDAEVTVSMPDGSIVNGPHSVTAHHPCNFRRIYLQVAGIDSAPAKGIYVVSVKNHATVRPVECTWQVR